MPEPEWIECGKPWRELSDVITAGMQIEIDDGTRFLVGDLNVQSGVCDHCTYRDAVIVRYRVLVSPERLA